MVEMDLGTTVPSKRRWLSNLKFILVAGGGLFGDGWLNSNIGLVVPMIGYIYFQDQKGAVTAIQGSEIKGAFSIGMILGQLLFGVLGDALGRHVVYGKECLFAIFGTLFVILLPWNGLSHQGIIAWLAVFRVVSGMGAGGDYPMTSTLSAEHSPIWTRARLIMFVFSFNALGGFACGIVYIILIYAFKSSVESNINHLEWVWRLLLGIGIVPAVFTLYARLRMKETKPYEQYVATETSLVDRNKRGFVDQMRDFRDYFGEWRHAKVLVATCMCWFLFDIAYYGISLNQSIILKDIGYSGGKTPWETLQKTAIGNIIVILSGQLPGVYGGIFLPDLFGRRALQFWSSLITATIYAIWAGVSDISSSGGLITLFALSQLALNLGPTITTFLIPVELFPTRVRGSAHGLSAASGKVGAVLTAYAFGTINDTLGIRGALGLFAGVMALVAVFTLWIPESRGFTLEEIEGGALFGDKDRNGGSDESVTMPSPDVVGQDDGKMARVGVAAKDGGSDAAV